MANSIKRAVILAGAALTMLATSANATTQLELGGARRIISVSTYANLAVIRFSPALPGLEDCGTSEHVHIDWAGTNAANKNMYASLLMAVAMDLKIIVGLDGCSNDNAPLAYRIDLIP